MTAIVDGSLTFNGGQNDGIAPNELQGNQFAKGVNVTLKNGYIEPRPAFVHQEVSFEGGEKINNISLKDLFKRGKFQAGLSYDAEDGEFLLLVFSGIIYRVDTITLKVEVISIGEDGDTLNPYSKRIPWSHAGRFVVFFDSSNLPVIVENLTARRANPDRESSPGVPLPEIPTSSLGAFVQNRLWVANDQHEFGAGDPVGGINRDAPITFEESLASAGAFNGQFFSLGSQSLNQPITAMGFLQVADSSTGVGPLIVATKNSISAFSADIPRSQWENSQFGRMLLFNAGIAGPRAFVNVNSDLIFLSGENKIHSLFVGRAEQEKWTNAPISKEVEGWLTQFEDKELLEIGFCSYHNGRVFASVAPYRTKAIDSFGNDVFDYAHAGVVVLELDNVSGIGDAGQPAWSGLWEGISPMEMISTKNGLFILSKDDGGVNTLYLLDESKTYDVIQGENRNIVSRVYTKSYDFNLRMIDKEIGFVDYSLLNVDGDLSFKSEYKSSHASRWSLWKDFKYKAETTTEKAKDSLPLLSPHNLRELNFGDPEELDCDEITEDSSNILKDVQLRLTISAKNWSLRGIRLKFNSIDSEERPSISRCKENLKTKIFEKEELLDWEIYRTSPEGQLWL